MTDVALDTQTPTTAAAPKIVAMRDVALGGGRTALISLATVVVLLSSWGLATEFRLVSPLFLPTPSEVVTQFVAVFQDGYANATLSEHLGASLFRISVAAGVVLFAALSQRSVPATEPSRPNIEGP